MLPPDRDVGRRPGRTRRCPVARTRSDVGARRARGRRSDAEIVVVHDAARPLATPALFELVIDAVRAGADGAVPGGAGRRHAEARRRRIASSTTVDRDGLVAVQTPQAFRADRLRAAHAVGADATDDAALVEARRWHRRRRRGRPRNVKVTTVADLTVVEALLASIEHEARR